VIQRRRQLIVTRKLKVPQHAEQVEIHEPGLLVQQ
jgi:hypothetical protein